MELQRSTHELARVSQRSPRKRMEGSDYEDKCSQWADDVGRVSNRKKRKDKSKRKRIGVNCDSNFFFLSQER